ncbi:MAG: hemolysin family protein [Chitinophagaceae bacterium]|jgi:putative hemolysin
MDILYTIGYIALTLVFIGFFAGYEIAFVSVNRLSIELKKKQGKSSGIILSKFMHEPTKFISSCLVGLNIFLVIYGLLFSELLHHSLWIPFKIENQFVRLIIDSVLSTIVVLVIGEYIPKAIFRAKNDMLLTIFAPIANLFYKILSPLASLFVDISNWILKYLFNINVKNKAEAFSHVDLEYFIAQNTEDVPDNPEHSKELLKNAMSLPTVKVRQCLVPRTEIEGVDINESIEEVTKCFIQTKLSKLIVWDDNIDDIKGYIHQLDLYKKPTSLKEILLPISVIPETMGASDLITKFTKERRSVAWVVDEFGGTAGIITMEDLLEEIFGEIKDEHDVEEFVEKQISETEFILSGRLELDYLIEKFGLSFPEDAGSETLSGYIIAEHETIPKRKESIIINNYQFDILNVGDTKVEMVKLKVLR